MGRDVAGLRIDKKSNVMDANSNGTSHVCPKGISEIVETKDYEQEEHTMKHRLSDEHQEKLNPAEPEKKVKRAEAMKTMDKKSSLPVKPESAAAVSDSADANTFDLAEKQSFPSDHVNVVAAVNDPGLNSETSEVVAVVSNPGLNSLPESTGLETGKNQPNAPWVRRKQLQSSDRHYYDEEDNWSMASSAATSRPLKSRITVPVAPRFTVVDRLERRKEFYTKLEEKHKALEKEKLEYEARTKEEEQAAIKLLRKNMVVKAKPVPNFYSEGPPPKVELKKLPVTRAKSPNLSRRKSCGDANKASPDDKGVRARHSEGVFREGTNSPKSKDRVGGSKLNGSNSNKLKVRSKLSNDQMENSTPVKESGNADIIAVES